VTPSATAIHPDNSLLLRAWYVSEHRLSELFSDENKAFFENITAQFDSYSRKMFLANALAEPVISFIRANHVNSLHDIISMQRLASGSIFVCDGTFHSKGLAGNASSPLVTLTSRRNSFPDDYRLQVNFSKSGLVTTTAFSALAGTRHLFVLATIQNVEGKLIECVPYIVGNLVQKPASGLALALHSSMEVSPEDVDQFSGIDFTRSVSKQELNQLKGISERTVKDVLCDLLSEIEAPKDWGGEECDLFSTNLRLQGRAVTAAFLLKGPARFHEMTIADCGKNGDQIIRLFNTGADLLIVQHCHKISPRLRNHVRNAAVARMSIACRYMFLDGYRTVNIMRHVGKIG
jgi:hypothetical protein